MSEIKVSKSEGDGLSGVWRDGALIASGWYADCLQIADALRTVEILHGCGFSCNTIKRSIRHPDNCVVYYDPEENP